MMDSLLMTCVPTFQLMNTSLRTSKDLATQIAGLVTATRADLGGFRGFHQQLLQAMLVTQTPSARYRSYELHKVVYIVQ